MGPPQEHLRSHDFIGREFDQRLVIEVKLVGRQRPVQIDFKAAPRLDFRVHLGIKQAPAIAALGFSPVKGQIRAFHELLGGAAMLGRHRYADTDA